MRTFLGDPGADRRAGGKLGRAETTAEGEGTNLFSPLFFAPTASCCKAGGWTTLNKVFPRGSFLPAPSAVVSARLSARPLHDLPLGILGCLRTVWRSLATWRCQNWMCGPSASNMHSQEWSIPKLSCSLTRNITSRSMENLAFHSLLRWERLLPIHYSLILMALYLDQPNTVFYTEIQITVCLSTLLFRRWENVLSFEQFFIFNRVTFDMEAGGGGGGGRAIRNSLCKNSLWGLLLPDFDFHYSFLYCLL